MEKRARLAVGAVFLINGLGIATFLPRLPEIQQRLGLSDAGLGAALTGVGFGGLIGSLAAGPIVSRLGSRRATLGRRVRSSVSPCSRWGSPRAAPCSLSPSRLSGLPTP